MEYAIYKQNMPTNTESGFKASIVLVATVNVPEGKCPIDYAREEFGIDRPMVTAVNGYTVHQQL